MKKENFLLGFFVVLLVIVIVAWYMNSAGVALSPSSSAPSSVTVGAQIDIALSTNLANGIDFGSVAGGTNDNPSIDNANGAGGTTTLSVIRQTSTNTDIKICVSASGNLNNAGATANIPLIGETYTFAATSSPSGPGGSTAFQVTPSVTASGTLTAASTTVFYRTWLDVPAGTAADTYTNQINFIAVQSTAACP